MSILDISAAIVIIYMRRIKTMKVNTPKIHGDIIIS